MPGGGVSYAHFIGRVKSELVPILKEKKKSKKDRESIWWLKAGVKQAIYNLPFRRVTLFIDP